MCDFVPPPGSQNEDLPLNCCAQAFWLHSNVTDEAFCRNEYSLMETNQRLSVIFQFWLMNTANLAGFVSLLFPGVGICTAKEKYIFDTSYEGYS